MKRRLTAVLAAAITLFSTGCGEVVDINSGEQNIATLSELEKWDMERSGSASSGAAAVPDAAVPAESDGVTADVPVTAAPKPAAGSGPELTGQGGSMYDCNGKLLMTTDKMTGERRIAADYAEPFGNILSSKSNGLCETFGSKLSKSGTSVQLTFDADIQSAIYRYMAEAGMKGSVVVMRTDGSLAAEVSYPSYDPAEYGEADDSTAWGSLSNHAMQSAPPGSVFKIMSEVIAEKHSIDTLYDDGTWYSDSGVIVNWDHDTNPYYPIEERSRYSAFVNSSNIFFAKAFDAVGAEAVTADLGEIFHFGRDIYCDFGTIITGMQIDNADDLRRSAFGQANVTTTPMYLAALGREAVFGEMVTPFVLMNEIKGEGAGQVKSRGTTPELIASIPMAYRQGLLEGMAGVGGDIGVYPPADYSFFAKTGTAETGWGEYMYITGCLRNTADDGGIRYKDYGNYSGSYIIVTQISNGGELGLTFASESAYLYQGIVNIVTGSR